jgi:3-deoxy-D-manno-octulosonate 8-phosphate phosphatase (KDO 8-P phosphatase)
MPKPKGRGPGTPATRAPLERGRIETPAPQRAPDPEVSLEELLHEPVRGPVRVLFLDADGTLTDGVIVFDSAGADARNFWIRDGLALEWARDLGVLPVVVSGRRSRAVEARMTELGVECHVGIKDKVALAQGIIERVGAHWGQCVMVGDDLPDAPLMRRVGWPIAVLDAVSEVRAIARTVTGQPGGRGAVREVVEMVLRHNGLWERVLQRYELA